jgi:hypothetical protein
MTSDAGEDVGEPSLWVDAVELGGADERVHDGRSLPSAVRSAEQPRLSTQGHAAQRPFSCVVGQADPAVVEKAGEGRPAAQHVVDGLGETMMARQQAALIRQPGVEVRNYR